MIIAENSPIVLLSINISGAWIHTVYKVYARATRNSINRPENESTPADEGAEKKFVCRKTIEAYVNFPFCRSCVRITNKAWVKPWTALKKYHAQPSRVDERLHDYITELSWFALLKVSHHKRLLTGGARVVPDRGAAIY